MITNKTEWQKVSKQVEIPMSLYYQFWKENKKEEYANLTEQEFTVLFKGFLTEALNTPIMIPDKTKAKISSFNGIIDKVYKYFNKKYE